mgnify:CR=1 FL=1
MPEFTVHFSLVTIQESTGPAQYPCEHTNNPALVIAACGSDSNGRPAFGAWRLVHVPSGLTLPIPVPHCDDIETLRWMGNQLANADIDWTADAAVLAKTAGPIVADLIRQADETDQATTPPGELATSTLRQICAANARVLAKESNGG